MSSIIVDHGCPIVWESKLQTEIALLMTEDEIYQLIHTTENDYPTADGDCTGTESKWIEHSHDNANDLLSIL